MGLKMMPDGLAIFVKMKEVCLHRKVLGGLLAEVAVCRHHINDKGKCMISACPVLHGHAEEASVDLQGEME